MPEPLDSRLRDDQALDEIELTSRLIIAASAQDRPLTQGEVDEILGLSERPRTAGDTRDSLA
ncbi:MAG: hypothetical protein JWR27_1858 [Aeromicrobium sp.]|jgi:hypothetical protein|nr:hypothetical protein [Aeromicrobium sp.]